MRFLPLIVALLLAGCGAEPAATAQPRDGTTLLLAGDGELWAVDVASGEVRHRRLAELRPGDPPHRVVRRGDRFVMFGFATWVLSDPGAAPVSLAPDSSFFIPSADDDRVWLATIPKGPTKMTVIREVTAGGRVTVVDTPTPHGEWPLSAVRSGIVYEDDDELVVWDPVAHREVRRVRGRFAGPGHGDLLVSAAPDECGDLLLTDVASGRERRVEPVGDGRCWDVWEAAFSPDGSRLAIAFGRTSGEEDSTRELALVDVATAKASPVPGSKVPSGYVFVDWSADGQEVFITGGDRARERTILAFGLGEASARRVDVEVGDFYDVAAR